MRVIQVILPDLKPYGRNRRRPTIVGDTGRRLELPFAPVEATIDGDAQAWQQITRTGLRPVLASAGGNLNTWSGTLMLARPDYQQSVQDLVDGIRRFADSGEAVTFHAGGPERGRWRITAAPVDVLLRCPGTNDAARASVALTLTEASDVGTSVGPVSGGASRPPPGHPTGDRATHASVRTWKIRSGDTLWRIAGAVYGNPNLWPRIADANKVRNPRALRIGTLLVIP